MTRLCVSILISRERLKNVWSIGSISMYSYSYSLLLPTVGLLGVIVQCVANVSNTHLVYIN